MTACPGFGNFIVSNSLDKLDPKTRKFIRSYVMRGKNKRRPNLRRGSINDNVVTRQKSREHQPPQSTELSNDQAWIIVPQQNFFNQFSLLGFGDDLKPYMRLLIHQGKELES